MTFYKNKIFIAFLLLLTAGLLLFTACAGPEESSKDTGSEQNTESKKEEDYPDALDFYVYNSMGQKVNLSDFKGKAVIVNFWASWCTPCKAELPDFQSVYDVHKGEVVFLMVNLTDGSRETKEKAAAYINDEGYTFPIYYDMDGYASNTYSIRSIPTTIFVDTEGKLRKTHIGLANEQLLLSELSKMMD